MESLAQTRPSKPFTFKLADVRVLRILRGLLDQRFIDGESIGAKKWKHNEQIYLVLIKRKRDQAETDGTIRFAHKEADG